MFNLKRKLKTFVGSFKDPQKIVVEIHEAFDASTEKLLSEAKNILGGSYDLEKGERLKKLGFTSAKKSVESDKIKAELQENKNLASLIERYSVSYPNNKFITEKMVESICKKYGLLFADIQYYISDVPEKNIAELEAFYLKEEDMVKYHLHYYGFDSRGYYRPNYKKDGSAFYGYLKQVRWGHEAIKCDEAQKWAYEKPAFKICAPQKDFDIKNMRIEGGYRLNQNIPDPIVLQPVKGGYLVVTKWGIGAEDKGLLNEKMN